MPWLLVAPILYKEALLCTVLPFSSAYTDLTAMRELQAARDGDWLVAQLQALVEVAFKMATGPVEALRPLGLKLLKVFFSQKLQNLSY